MTATKGTNDPAPDPGAGRPATDLETRLIALAAARFGKDPSALAPADDLFETLEIDSFQAMELLTELEETFDVEVPDYEVQRVRSFAGLAEVIGRRL